MDFFLDRDVQKSALSGVMIFGMVSLLGDIIYEGSRGVVPTYLQLLGLSALSVGFLLSLGEFVGYALRLLSGYASEATGAYWTFVIAGYGMLISIPLISAAGSWQVVVLLVLLERFAKALRAPARDALIASVSKGLGSGKAFGLHELFDQVGAILGPAIMAAMLFSAKNDYRFAFGVMVIPYLGLFVALLYAYSKFGGYTKMGATKTESSPKSKSPLPTEFKLYTLAVGINAIGIFQASLILYAAKLVGMEPWQISTVYLLIQGVDAISALLSGFAFDRYGIKFLAIPFLLSIAPTLLGFGDSLTSILSAAIIFGVVYGAQESIYRAAVSELAPPERRGSAYGWFNVVYGIGFVIGGTVMGYFLDNYMRLAAIALSSALQLASTAILIKISSKKEIRNA